MRTDFESTATHAAKEAEEMRDKLGALVDLMGRHDGKLRELEQVVDRLDGPKPPEPLI